MSTKKDVLGFLEQQKGEAISGAAIAEQLSVSRTAVWKAINDLRNEGYTIKGATNKGYLLAPNDILSEEGIRSFLSGDQPFHIHVFPSVSSTSDVAKEMAAKGAPGNTVIAAETQTAGKGRRGRSFFSPAKSGVYVSLLIKPEEGWNTPDTAVLLTTAASVAVARAVEQVSGKRVSIKWVNDLYINDRKICGILTEGITSLETGAIEAAVLGIGINLYTPKGGYPDELQDRAASLMGDESASGPDVGNCGCGSRYGERDGDTAAGERCGSRPSRNQLIAAVLDQLAVVQKELSSKAFIAEYKERSCVIGKEIRVISAKGEENALALDIDENGGLLIRLENGTEKVLNSGEITIRFQDGGLK